VICGWDAICGYWVIVGQPLEREDTESEKRFKEEASK